MGDQRFTVDGSAELERQLHTLCGLVRTAVLTEVPETRLQALVLGGGYGRGEGGVLRTREGDRPYNDLEFYVFVRGNPLLNEHRYGATLRRVAEELTRGADLHVEFKLEEIEHFEARPISMFSYDLVSGHRVIKGDCGVFRHCTRHLDASRIPLEEATRLLVNRCTGLLIARQFLRAGALTPDRADFIGRNLAKMKLALGDVALTEAGRYHWSVRERLRRFEAGEYDPGFPACEFIREHYPAGVEFKLHPVRARPAAEDLETEFVEVSGLAAKVWLWVESRRLGRPFSSLNEYALAPLPKWPGPPAWRNCVLNLRSFGPRSVVDSMGRRYPRERLLNCLPLLLWDDAWQEEPRLRRHLQTQLRTTASSWPGMVAAYRQAWPKFG